MNRRRFSRKLIWQHSILNAFKFWFYFRKETCFVFWSFMFPIYFRMQIITIYPLRVVPSSSKQELKRYFEIGHDGFLPNFFNSSFTITVTSTLHNPRNWRALKVICSSWLFTIYTRYTCGGNKATFTEEPLLNKMDHRFIVGYRGEWVYRRVILW